MNLITRIFAVGSMLVASHLFAASPFEGKVTLTMTGDRGKPMDMNYSMKGERVRMDLNASGHEMSTIMDVPKLEMIILMSERNMYMVMPLKKPVEDAIEQHRGDAAPNVDINRTGKTETILGYKAEQLLITDKDKGTVTEIWMAPDLGSFMGLGNGGGSPFGGRKHSASAAKWEEALKGSKGGFPLRVITHDTKGKETFKMEATKIEPGPLPESLFVPPPGYQKFEMPNLGGLNPFKHE